MFVERDSGVLFKNRIEGLKGLSVEEKSLRLRGDVFFAVDSVMEWNAAHKDMRSMEEMPPVYELWEGEIEEAREVLPLFEKLRDIEIECEWYEDPFAKERWEVAGELADVVIYGIDVLVREGWSREKIAVALISHGSMGEMEGQRTYSVVRTLQNAGEMCGEIGIDIFEAVAYKVIQNEQNRSRALRGRFQNGGFMGKIREERRRKTGSTQIPALSQSVLSPTVIENYVERSPFSSNGSAVVVPLLGTLKGLAELPSMDTNDYGELYLN